MSVSSVSASGGLSQLMAAFLARIKASEQASQTASTTTTTAATATDPSATQSADSCNAASSASEPTLSDQVISTLVALQMQNGASATDPSAATSTASSTGSDPAAQAFAALDTNGDGTISQSELETGIENVGGTSDEADAVFSALGGTSSTGISESGFASAAQAGAPPGGPQGPSGAHGHHHHHHGSGSSSAATDPSQLFSAIDSNDDGSISPDELASALGGTSSPSADGTTTTGSTTDSTTDGSTAATQFAAIDSNGDGSVSQDELKTYLGNLQDAATNDQATINSFLQLANQSYSQSMSLMDPSTILSSSTA